MYIPRIVDKILQERLESKGAILIEGPKWSGKTWTARQQAGSVLNLANPKTLSESRNLIEVVPDTLLQGDTPRLIDEWQEIPSIWDFVRNEVDERQKMGQFILTGSAVPRESNEILHSGTGRIGRLCMRTMSLWESNESSGEISLGNLFEGEEPKVGRNKHTLQQVAFMICRGGWPLSVTLKESAALRQAVDYFDAVANSDIKRIDNVKRSSSLIKKIMRSYARHVGYQTPNTTIQQDTKEGERLYDLATIADYIDSLKKIFVVEEMQSWNPNLRSKTAIRTSETRYYTDPSIGCAALGIGPGALMKDLKTFGMMFENLCVRDLRIYAEANDGEVYHYRDANGLECDAVVHLRNGKFGLIEIKLGGETQIEEGCKSLKKLESKIDEATMGKASFLMVATAVGDYAYKRKDGVWVVPIGCLKD